MKPEPAAEPAPRAKVLKHTPSAVLEYILWELEGGPAETDWQREMAADGEAALYLPLLCQIGKRITELLALLLDDPAPAPAPEAPPAEAAAPASNGLTDEEKEKALSRWEAPEPANPAKRKAAQKAAEA